MRKWTATILVVILLGIAVFLICASLWGGRFVVGTVDQVVNEIVRVSHLSPWLVKGVVLVLTIPFFWAVANYSKLWWGHNPLRPSLNLYLNKHGIIIVLYVAAFFLSMYFVSRGAYYDTQGKHIKWCAETAEGIREFDSEGVDPIYGVPLKPCSEDQILALRKKTAGIQEPTLLAIADPRTFAFFDGVSGRPLVWYSRAVDGQIELYDKPGTHPRTGAQLTPIDRLVVEEVIRRHDERTHQVEEQTRQAAAVEVARQEQTLIDHYLDRTIVNEPARTQVAILVQEGPLPAILEESLAASLRTLGAEPLQSFFKPAFTHDGRARALLDGDWASISALKLEEHIDAVLVVAARTAVTSSTQFDGLNSATLTLDLSCVQVVLRRRCGSHTINSQGAGFSKDAATLNAAEKVLPALRPALADMRF